MQSGFWYRGLIVASILLIGCTSQEQSSMMLEPGPPQENGNADVTFVRAVQTASDTGWNDYADGWDVLLPDGFVVGPESDAPFTRLLLHPHEGEQPFTRSQSGITLPSDVTMITVRAHDLIDGFGGRQVVVDLLQTSGPDFEVERLP